MFGFQSFGDFFNAIFKNIDTNFIIKYLVPFGIVIDAVFNFLFQNNNAIYFLITLYLIDFLTGIIKAIYISLEIKRFKNLNKPIPESFHSKKLVSKKFPRFLMTMLAALLILTLVKFAGIHSVIFLPLYSLSYSIFLGQQLISIAENLSELKLLPFNIVKKLKSKLSDFSKG
ncbi:phage holin family protein [Algoriphagus sp. AK58]|uniref:phage holin family protein n=1 Tax=Algoriphagus sp. AK58 TaxID=1406877 RepID=UPI001650CDE0|nr:phage holin family protein [Algoriphagus sp. AK58]MBC6365789.1 hypothetical protein [Algoriphagus sp. AK58]